MGAVGARCRIRVPAAGGPALAPTAATATGCAAAMRSAAGPEKVIGVKTSNIRFMDQANRIRARITAASGSMSGAKGVYH